VRGGARLPRGFYARPPTEVAPDLLGRLLVRRELDGTRLVVRIVETEAYDEGDPASHSFRGPTARNEVMFGGAGRLYVYFTYGMHFCMNVVTGVKGRGSAVLLRAAEPVEGFDVMRRRRGTSDMRRLCSGPARLCDALAVGRPENGVDLVRGGGVWLLEGDPPGRGSILRTTRVGVRNGAEREWRFLIRDDPFVSRRPATG
jgi:DNA-3-methyladenine glycosylase